MGVADKRNESSQADYRACKRWLTAAAAVAGYPAIRRG